MQGVHLIAARVPKMSANLPHATTRSLSVSMAGRKRSRTRGGWRGEVSAVGMVMDISTTQASIAIISVVESVQIVPWGEEHENLCNGNSQDEHAMSWHCLVFFGCLSSRR
jgi:hypothetical protein